MAQPYSVCIILPNKPVYSETFIKNHLEKLPGTIRSLYGYPFPTHHANGRRFLPVPLPAGIRSRVLARVLRSNSFDVVLAEYGPTGAEVMNACSLAKTPLVVHFHGFDAYEKSTLNKYRTAYRAMFERASAVIAVSHDMERQLTELGASPQKLRYSPYGVDCEQFAKAAPAKAAVQFLAVGRFVEKKAPQSTLAAFHRVVERFPGARLIMIGDGPLLETCKAMAAASRIAGSVEFCGSRPNNEVAEAMRASRAFVQHSVRTAAGDSEGTPVAIIEAGASGLPVVATRHAGIKDVVIEGETGFLVDEGDVASMATHMIHLAENPDAAASIGERARQHIAANFSLSSSINRLSTILEDAIKQARRSG